MSAPEILTTLEQSDFASWVGGNIAGSELVFPIVETLHVLAIALVFGSIFYVDLRLLGLSARANPASRIARELLPWTWAAFAAAILTGGLMFAAHATTYWDNTQFRLKFLFIAFAGINMAVFQFGAFRRVVEWDLALPTPSAARAAGGLSIALWLTVIFLGRWVGFTT